MTKKSLKPNRPRKTSYEAVSPEIQRHACQSIEDHIYWHIGGVAAMSTNTGLPEVGTVTAVRWKNRSFLLTAGHVVDDFADSELHFVFRPPGALNPGLWWQSSNPGAELFRGEPLPVIRRYRSSREDIAALEVSASLEDTTRVRFYNLDEGSKIVRPIRSSACAIGLPFDSFERLNPGAIAFSMFALWGNFVPPGRRIFDDFSPRKNLLMEFLPAIDERKPGGFSGAGAWYQPPTAKTPLVWAPAPILAGLITHYYRTQKVLLVCRVERLVAFLREIDG